MPEVSEVVLERNAVCACVRFLVRPRGTVLGGNKRRLVPFGSCLGTCADQLVGSVQRRCVITEPKVVRESELDFGCVCPQVNGAISRW